MRVLYIPQVSTGEVEAESDVYSFKCVDRALRTIEPTFAYWWLRQGDEKRVVDRPGSFHVFDEMPMSFYAQMATVNLGKLVDLFSWQRGIYPVEAVFTSRPAIGTLLQLAIADMSGQYPVPVVLTEPRVYGPDEHGHNQVHPTQLALRAAGYATCFGMYWSKWERQAAIDAASQYVSAAVVKTMEERAFVVDALVDVDELVYVIGRVSRPKRLLFAGRLNSNKRYEEVVEAYGRVLMARPAGEVEVWVHSGTGAFSKLEAREHRWHQTSERLSRQAYWELLGASHVAAYFSHDEGANVTVQEMLASGIVMALPNRPWVHKLFDPHRYPYVVDRLEDLPATLDWLIDHYGEAHAVLAPIRGLIAEERSWPAFLAKFRRVYDAVRSIETPPAFRVFRTVALEELARRPNGRMALSSAIRLNPQWQRSAPKYSAIRGLVHCWRAVRDLDDMTAADPMLDLSRRAEAPVA